MNNLLSYCGLVDAKVRVSDIDLPVLGLLKGWSIKKRIAIFIIVKMALPFKVHWNI